MKKLITTSLLALALLAPNVSADFPQACHKAIISHLAGALSCKAPVPADTSKITLTEFLGIISVLEKGSKKCQSAAVTITKACWT